MTEANELKGLFYFIDLGFYNFERIPWNEIRAFDVCLVLDTLDFLERIV